MTVDRTEFSDDWEAERRQHLADADADAREQDPGYDEREAALTVGERNR